MKTINGVFGPIPIKELGFTLMHEHLFSADWSMRTAFLKDWVDVDEFIPMLVKELNIAKIYGVDTIVDMTPINLGRDINVLRKAAKLCDIQVIAATGFYWNEEPWLYDKDERIIVDLLLKDILEGIQGTDSKAAILKCATGPLGMTEINKMTFRIVAAAHKESHVPIYTHTIADSKMGHLQLDILEKEGIDIENVVIGHLGDTTDINYLESVLKRGCYIGLDRFGDDSRLSLDDRANTLTTLCKRGYIDKLIVSQDYCAFLDQGIYNWKDYIGLDVSKLEVDFTYIHRRVIPELLKRGITEQQIHRMMVLNPQEFFEKC